MGSIMLMLCLCAVCSGLLLTASMPHLAWWPLSLVACVPFFIALRARPALRWREVFLAALCLTATWHLCALWWISLVTFAGMAALALCLAVFAAAVLTLAWWLDRRGVPFWIAVPGAWMLFELFITHLFLSGFPWLLVGYAWRPLIPLIQCADLGGVPMISAAVMLCNAALAHAAVPSSPGLRARWGGVLVSVLVIGCMYAYGVRRIGQLDAVPPRCTLAIACVQPNVPALVKHDPSRDDDTFAQLRALTLTAATEQVDLIFWPETAPPGYFFEYGRTYREVTNTVAMVQRPILSGLARYEHGDGRLDYYNSAGLIAPGGSVGTLYDKMHLVMFGEYVPLQEYLPFLSLVTPIEASYSSGPMPHLLVFADGSERVHFGPLICFEDVFGYMARLMTRTGADVLVNLTNDGWFKSSPGPYQHVALAALRCVETRRPLVRCTNSGVTALIDRLGRVTAAFDVQGLQTEVEGVLFGTVDVHDGPTTLYVRWGDWFLVVWVGVMAGLILWAALRTRPAS